MRLSEDKINRIKEEILSTMFRNSPKALFASDIAHNIIRDEEFTKKLLLELEEKNLISRVSKNNHGIDYTKRMRWRLTSPVYQAYEQINTKNVFYDEKEHEYSL